MRITAEMLKARDENGNLVNFVFCNRCVKFYVLNDCKEGMIIVVNHVEPGSI